MRNYLDPVVTYNYSETLVDRSWIDPDRQHDLIKVDNGLQCQCCCRKWLKKPRAKCLGLPVYPDAAARLDCHQLISLDDAIRTRATSAEVYLLSPAGVYLVSQDFFGSMLNHRP